MPRGARKKGTTGIYHIMLRGIGQQQIFFDEEDNEVFLTILNEYKEKSGYEVYAYCMMGNHVHLLMREGEKGEALQQIFRRIGAKYVYWYNVKYKRIGHLFQDRFKSEPVEDDRYLLAVMRYIHQNPVKAGLVTHAKEYGRSSYQAYLGEDDVGLIDTRMISGLMSKEAYESFHADETEENCIDLTAPRKGITDTRVREIMERESGCREPMSFASADEAQKIKAVQAMVDEGASLRQASRVTGMSIGWIRHKIR